MNDNMKRCILVDNENKLGLWLVRKCSRIHVFPIQKCLYVAALSVDTRRPFTPAKGLANEVKHSPPSGAELNNTCNLFPFLAVFRLGT